MLISKWLMIVLLLCVTYATACGRGEAAPAEGGEDTSEQVEATPEGGEDASEQVEATPEQGAASPQDAVEQVVAAAKTQDRGAILLLIDATPEERDFFDAIFDVGITTERFKQAMIAAYGEAGWQEFNDKGGARLDFYFRVDADSEQAKIREQGETATAVLNGKEVELIKKDGRWYFDATSMVTTSNDGDPEKVAKLMRGMEAIVKRYEARIGEEGLTAERIDQEMGRDAIALLLSLREEGSGLKLDVNVQVHPAE